MDQRQFSLIKHLLDTPDFYRKAKANMNMKSFMSQIDGKDLVAIAGIQSEKGDHIYNVQLKFFNVQVSDNQDATHTIPTKDKAGKTVFFAPIHSNSLCEINCGCHDFIWSNNKYEGMKKLSEQEHVEFQLASPVCKHVISAVKSLIAAHALLPTASL
jgi:hypothetical protein